MAPADPKAENRFKCPHCGVTNVIKGHPGEPGEGTLNPAATALSDDELAEAAHRRGILHKINVGGTITPEGDAS